MSQNAENMAKIREDMRKAQNAEKVNAGNKYVTEFSIDFTSSEGNHFEGVVKCKRPGMGDIIQIGARKSERLRQAGVSDLALVDELVLFTNHVITLLDYVMIERPDWLKNMDAMQDVDVLYHVYGKFETWQNSFRKSSGETDDLRNSGTALGATEVETT